MTVEHDHLPARLWWLLAALSLAWGFNWTALKLALGEIPPWTFRSICLGAGSLVLFAVLRLGGQPFVWPAGQWRRLVNAFTISARSPRLRRIPHRAARAGNH